MTDTATSRWVEGPFAPVREETTAFDLRVTGTARVRRFSRPPAEYICFGLALATDA